jgi:hypothetical protein
MNSKIFKVNLTDVARAAGSAVFVAALTTLYGVSVQEGFDIFTADWMAIGKMTLNASFAAFLGHFGSIFLSDSEGKLLGKI